MGEVGRVLGEGGGGLGEGVPLADPEADHPLGAHDREHDQRHHAGGPRGEPAHEGRARPVDLGGPHPADPGAGAGDDEPEARAALLAARPALEGLDRGDEATAQRGLERLDLAGLAEGVAGRPPLAQEREGGREPGADPERDDQQHRGGGALGPHHRREGQQHRGERGQQERATGDAGQEERPLAQDEPGDEAADPADVLCQTGPRARVS